jgi:hypothetical protein
LLLLLLTVLLLLRRPHNTPSSVLPETNLLSRSSPPHHAKHDNPSLDYGRTLLRCPFGSYQGGRVAAAEAHAKLTAHWERLVALGYRPLNVSNHARRRAVERGFVTYESPLWLRPAHCGMSRKARRPRPVVDEPPGTCEPDGVTCDKYRLSRAHRFVWHHVWKGGTTSLSPYLTCNMGAEPVPGLLRQQASSIAGYLHVGTARSPLPRFLSAFQEVFSRMRVRTAAEKCFHRHVPWLLVAMARSLPTAPHSTASPAAPPHKIHRARRRRRTRRMAMTGPCTDPEATLNTSALRAILRQFIADVECSVRFPNGEHLYSQSLFLGGNASSPHPIDMLLRLETLDADLRLLKKRVGYGDTRDACPLKTERAAATKPRAVPTATLLLSLLRDEPELLQSLCNVYIQDFVCLGYALPDGCELLPPRAARPPPTIDISASDLTIS